MAVNPKSVIYKVCGFYQNLKLSYHQESGKTTQRNGRKYLQTIYLITDLYVVYISNTYSSIVKDK